MKKIRFSVLTGLILALFISASEWEGSATASVDGDMPASGLYAATNSFPRNTIIEITNLEDLSTPPVRARIFRGLDNPGLLVVLSKEAAEAIGLNPGSLGRVRMKQISEPLAGEVDRTVYAPGDPDFDSMSSVRMNGGLDPALWEEMNSLLAAEMAALREAELYAEEIARLEAERVRQNETAPAVSPAGSAPDETPQPAPVPAEDIRPQENTANPPPSVAEEPSPQAVQSYPNPAEPSGQALNSNPAPAGTAPAEAPLDYLSDYDNYDFYVVPAEPRLPVPSTPEPYIDPRDILVPLDQYPSDYYPRNLFPESAPDQGLANVTPPQAYPPSNAYQLDEYPREAYPNPAYVIPPVNTQPPPSQPAREYYIDPADIIPSIEETPPRQPQPVTPSIYVTPAVPAAAPPAPAGRNFSVPVITSLERGRYYIQVAAGAEAEGIESEIRKIGNGFPMAVMPIGTGGRPLYRLLIGPVNLGESGALLERFKASYKDAFIRTGF